MPPPPPSPPSSNPTISTTNRPSPVSTHRPATISARPPTTPRLALRPTILSLSVVAIAATGAWYGASLKGSRETQQEVKKQRTATPHERIAYLEQRRARMEGVKRGLESKIGALQVRQIEARAGGKGEEGG